MSAENGKRPIQEDEEETSTKRQCTETSINALAALHQAEQKLVYYRVTNAVTRQRFKSSFAHFANYFGLIEDGKVICRTEGGPETDTPVEVFKENPWYMLSTKKVIPYWENLSMVYDDDNYCWMVESNGVLYSLNEVAFFLLGSAKVISNKTRTGSTFIKTRLITDCWIKHKHPKVNETAGDVFSGLLSVDDRAEFPVYTVKEGVTVHACKMFKPVDLDCYAKPKDNVKLYMLVDFTSPNIGHTTYFNVHIEGIFEGDISLPNVI